MLEMCTVGQWSTQQVKLTSKLSVRVWSLITCWLDNPTPILLFVKSKSLARNQLMVCDGIIPDGNSCVWTFKAYLYFSLGISSFPHFFLLRYLFKLSDYNLERIRANEEHRAKQASNTVQCRVGRRSKQSNRQQSRRAMGRKNLHTHPKHQHPWVVDSRLEKGTFRGQGCALQ